MGVGIIALDHNGHVWASMCTTKPYVSNPTMAEALAAQQGMEHCCKLELQSCWKAMLRRQFLLWKLEEILQVGMEAWLLMLDTS